MPDAEKEPKPIQLGEQPVELGKLLEKVSPGSLKSMPQKKAEILRRTLVSFRSGPLPSPEEFAEYDRVLPGASDRILRMAEAQHTHRISMEKHVIESQQVMAARGQFFGLLIGLTGLVTAAVCASFGATAVGVTVGGGTLVSMVYAFVKGRETQRRSLEGKKPPPH